MKTKKSAVLTIAIVLFTAYSFAQCTLTTGINGTTNQSTTICLGQSVTLNSTANCNILMSNNFNTGVIGTGWSSNCSPMFNNPCNTAMDGTTYLWVGDASSFPRDLTTVDYEIDCPGQNVTISFGLRFAVQGEASPCEGPDEMDEGVSLQYSTNGGASWVDITYFCPDGNQYPTNSWVGQSTAGGSGMTNFTSWATYTFNVPAAAKTCNTRFRWHQEQVTDQYCDHWGIENVNINIVPAPVTTTTWSLLGTPFSNTANTTVTPPAAGTYVYQCAATTGCNCGGVTSNLTVTVNPFPTVIATANPTTICTGQSSTLTAGGATTYTWSHGLGAGNPVTVSPVVTTTYTVTGSNGGCPGTASVVVTVAPNLNITVTPNPASICPGESSTLTAVGGTTYNWSGGLGAANPLTVTPPITTTYTVTGTTGSCTGTGTAVVTVTNNPTITITPNPISICQGASSTLTATGATNYTWGGGLGIANPLVVTPAVTTTYSVTGTTGSCTGSGTAVVTVYPNPNISITPNPAAVCSGMSSTLTANGGNTYVWGGGLGIINPLVVTPITTTTYSVTGTDGNGCTGSAQTVVTLSPGFTVNVNTTDEHCGRADGTATATPIGGTGPFTYSWTGGLNTQTITGLTAGTYNVTVTDNNGCTGTGSGTFVNIAGPSAPFGTIVNETCSYCNGSITIAPVNGTPPYTYVWSVAGAGATISNLCAGNYAVTVTDANTCTANNNTSITNSPAPVLSQGPITSANCGFNDGGAQPTISGGTAPITYAWSNSQATLNLSNVIGGNYTLIATDANGCKDTLIVTVPTIGGPSASTTGTDALCSNANGTACVSASGGSGAYTYIWNNGLNTSCISNLSPGLYTVTVDDGNCFVISSYSVGDIPGPNADFTVTPHTTTIDNPLFNFYDQSTGATTYAWYFGDGGTSNTQNPTYSYSQSGTFIITLIVTNNAGCVDSIKQEVIIKDNFVIWVPNAFSPNGDGMNETFGPKGVGLDPEHFEFYIFDRWGEEIFRSTNVNLQWDGTYKGGKPKQDVYTWLIIIKGIDGLPYKYNGHVTLIK